MKQKLPSPTVSTQPGQAQVRRPRVVRQAPVGVDPEELDVLMGEVVAVAARSNELWRDVEQARTVVAALMAQLRPAPLRYQRACTEGALAERAESEAG